MSLLIDPRICPDCRALLDVSGTCTGCALQLTGPLARELWQTMQSADAIVERLRAQAPTTHPAPRAGSEPALPAVPMTRPKRRSGLSAASVPTVLFGVGALCLLVAAVVFVAVAWSSLGLGARTSILLAVTGTFAALATRLTLRGLRGAAETFWAVVGALVTIDVIAAHAAGLVGFDRIDERHASAVLGVALLGLGLAVGIWVRRTDLAMLVVPTVLSTVGTVLLVAAEGWAAPDAAVGSALSIPALGALVALTWRLALRPTAYAVATIGVVSWIVLVGTGLDRMATTTTAAWWSGQGWPLLVAAAVAAALALAATAPETVRTAAAAAAELTLVLLVVGPGARTDTEIVVLAVLVLALAGASWVAPRVWAVPAACYAGLGVLVAAGYAAVRPLSVVSALPTTGPAHATNLDQQLARSTESAAPWTAIVVVAVVILAGLALIRWLADPAARESAERAWVVGAPAVAVVGVVTAYLETGPDLLPAVLAWSLSLVALGAGASVLRGAPGPAVLAGAGYLGVVGLRLAVPSHLLVALLATALAVAFAIAYRRTGTDPVTRALTGAAAVVAAGFAATHWPYLAGGTGDAAGLTLAVVAATGGVLAAWVAREGDGPVLEVTALALGLGAVAFPVQDAVTTLVLTIVGSAVALVSVLHRDREEAAWIGSAILAVAAAARFAYDLSVPELATAPAAALLLAAGVHRMRTDAEAASVRVLGSGLTLAVLPTLLLSIDEPVSARAALLGLGALVALGVGVSERWAAPFVAGAGVLAVLAVRHLGPVAEALPRWISLGSVGVLLLAVAVTWEARRRQLEVAERYLAALR